MNLRPLTLAIALTLGTSAALAQTEVGATLAGHAYLAADTTVSAPRDAGPLFATSGKFANGKRQRVTELGSVPANTFVGDPKQPRASGGFLPVKGQSVQGLSRSARTSS
ncbi:hypothetical protein [Malikia granosa]|uniref:hypothetical protein n=1 Tax=Malikia granosa TaxID=263067 RepID=UPI001FE26E4F|nr:hypothetical protein [Malikia granosa]